MGTENEIFLKEYGNKLEPEEKIDFILEYEAGQEQDREEFEGNLNNAGLKFEKCVDEQFLKIHIPLKTIEKNCAIKKIKLPISEYYNETLFKQSEKKKPVSVKKENIFRRFLRKFKEYLKEDVNENKTYRPHLEYNEERRKLFGLDRAENSQDVFPDIIRINLVNFILENIKPHGLQYLLHKNVYTSAYPLHEEKDGKTLRNYLINNWACLKSWIKLQPLNSIRNYFGETIALYFAWTGFYTNMLISASLLGIPCLLYGLFSMSFDSLSNDICKDDLNITMCPICDVNCDYWKLKNICVEAKLTYIFDNHATIVFTFLMSIWSTLYLKLWLRFSAKVSLQWGLNDYTDMVELPRPNYNEKKELLTNIKSFLCKKKPEEKSRTTNNQHEDPSFWKIRFPLKLISFGTSLVVITMVSIAAVGIMLYRMSQYASNSFFASHRELYMIGQMIPAVLNLILICIANEFYKNIAYSLTNLEAFINYYSSLFYIAFFKGKFVGTPNSYNRIFGFRQEECGAAGCYFELSVQIMVIMTGKKIFDHFREYITRLYKQTKLKKNSNKRNDNELDSSQKRPPDTDLLPMGETGIESEYLELVLQYGLVVLFISAFPLAPLFALFNNMLELRMDASKLLKHFKRPVPKRARNIGIWYGIVDMIGNFSVLCNAILIAGSSNFIPRLTYYLKTSSQVGYLNYSLANFNVSDFEKGSAPEYSIFGNVETCRYREFRYPFNVDKKYERSHMYWKVLFAKVFFVLIYQCVVFFMKMVVGCLVNDEPKKLRKQIAKENSIFLEHFIRISKNEESEELEKNTNMV